MFKFGTLGENECDNLEAKYACKTLKAIVLFFSIQPFRYSTSTTSDYTYRIKLCSMPLQIDVSLIANVIYVIHSHQD